jgi:hypothetical protein
MSNKKISPTNQEGGRVRSIARLLATAERELSAFVAAVNELFDAEHARHAGEIWMEELASTGWPGENPVADWHGVTIAAASRLAHLRR